MGKRTFQEEVCTAVREPSLNWESVLWKQSTGQPIPKQHPGSQGPTYPGGPALFPDRQVLPAAGIPSPAPLLCLLPAVSWGERLRQQWITHGGADFKVYGTGNKSRHHPGFVALLLDTLTTSSPAQGCNTDESHWLRFKFRVSTSLNVLSQWYEKAHVGTWDCRTRKGRRDIMSLLLCCHHRIQASSHNLSRKGTTEKGVKRQRQQTLKSFVPFDSSENLLFLQHSLTDSVTRKLHI